ncbi:hypothetical protein F7734_52780 [Scytonema sp. UIC 10036]|uniref:hypothetical protein n=1 Tax=Scytonema sp. UIC 10036 TaxID=2304196 RepID=UPI0012DAF06A|nr:hypothetical protein [Scytonema sp. UIC 10036]MUH00491.1 hypothetical protein [Scytonema sp. UIC 10036]
MEAPDNVATLFFESSEEKKCLVSCYAHAKGAEELAISIIEFNQKTKRYNVLLHGLNNTINLQETADLLTDIVKGYEVDLIVSNLTLKIIHTKYLKKKNLNYRWRTFALENEDYEKNILYARTLLSEKKLVINPEYQEDWDFEIKEFLIEECLAQTKTYPLLFTLFYALSVDIFVREPQAMMGRYNTYTQESKAWMTDGTIIETGKRPSLINQLRKINAERSKLGLPAINSISSSKYL